MAQKDQTSYLEKEILALTIKDEEKSYSQQIQFDCDYEGQIKLGTTLVIECSIINRGKVRLEEVEFCLGTLCSSVDLPPQAKETLQIETVEEEPGWKNVRVTAENDMIEKKSALASLVLDDPDLEVNLEAPEQVLFGEDFEVNLTLSKNSINSPQQVYIVLQGLGKRQILELDQLFSSQQLHINFEGEQLAHNNKVELSIEWKDLEGKSFYEEKELEFKGIGSSFSEKIRMWINSLLNLVS